jgi:hypothetical protein
MGWGAVRLSTVGTVEAGTTPHIPCLPGGGYGTVTLTAGVSPRTTFTPSTTPIDWTR